MADNLPIGTFLYSILEPNKFRCLNGEGWVLMDGQNITGSDLFNLTGISNLPDGRGFLLET